jgi:hypothetical protein
MGSLGDLLSRGPYAAFDGADCLPGDADGTVEDFEAEVSSQARTVGEKQPTPQSAVNPGKM